MADKNTFIIGISGGSGSGKSYLARHLAEGLGPDDCRIMEADAYYRDLSHLSLKEREKVNFDHPDAMELSLLADHILDLKAGKDIRIPVYDFSCHTRTDQTRHIVPARFIIIEGLMILTDPRIYERLDYTLYIDVPADLRFIRRLKRDITKRGRTMETVVKQYLTQARPMHDKFVAPGREKADLVLSENWMLDDVLATVRDAAAG